MYVIYIIIIILIVIKDIEIGNYIYRADLYFSKLIISITFYNTHTTCMLTNIIVHACDFRINQCNVARKLNFEIKIFTEVCELGQTK